MSSLNGDVFVMRNGRSTSQVSIYNYPEHLNPFYEDDQHKRLRFWHINKSGGSGSRRNSFSLGGLKDVWAFKSFRLKKKSSTLGINKTSESPPPLRRNLQHYSGENNLSLPDYRTRYSTPTGSGDSFQRNTVYRNSLQNVTSAKEKSGTQLDFNRNNQYRSTIQVMGTKTNNHNNKSNINARTMPVPQPRRYVYGGSVTPQPLRNSDIGAGAALSHGSSQISMASTNPFDTDDDDEENNEDISLVGDRQTIATSTPIKQRMHRKKRRAPAPPKIGIHEGNTSENLDSSGVSVLNSSHDGRIQPEPLPELRIEECMDIANLTAAIESFVKSTNDDSADTTQAAITEVQPTTEVVSTSITTKQNGEAKPVLESAHPSSSEVAEKVTVTMEPQKPNTNISIERNIGLAANESSKHPEPTQPIKETEVGHMECIHVHMGSPTASSDHHDSSKFTSFRGEETRSPERPRPITTKTSFTLTTPPTKRRDSAQNAKIALETTNDLKFPETEELKITEDATTSKRTKSPSALKPAAAIKPHLAEIHKPARGITSATTGEKEPVKGIRQPPISPVPPVRHRTAAKVHTNEAEGKKVVKANEVESESNQSESHHLQYTAKAPITSTQTLTITEPHENLPKKDEIQSHTTTIERNTGEPVLAETTQSHTALREAVLESLYRPKPNSTYLEWKQSSLAPLEKNVPPEKRKSVKDIIESINRSQRLLNAAANKDFTPAVASVSIKEGSNNNTPLTQRKFSDQSAIQTNLIDGQWICKEINGTAAAGGENECTASTSAATTDVSETVLNGDCDSQGEDPQKLNNNEIFKKCKVNKEAQYDYREQSPTASNLDWNPVPKPKRNKNLSEQ